MISLSLIFISGNEAEKVTEIEDKNEQRYWKKIIVSTNSTEDTGGRDRHVKKILSYPRLHYTQIRIDINYTRNYILKIWRGK